MKCRGSSAAFFRQPVINDPLGVYTAYGHDAACNLDRILFLLRYRCFHRHYIQSDPLGLAAGSTTYGYVDLNPLDYADQLGLAVDLNLFLPLSNIGRYAQMVPSEPGIYSVGAHGNPYNIADGDGNPLFAGDLASVIESDFNYQDGETVFLGSCNTGNDPGSWEVGGPFAEQLADALNAPVIAPTDYDW